MSHTLGGVSGVIALEEGTSARKEIHQYRERGRDSKSPSEH
jgi:hypothetical protein